jgi:outer membrane receptor protein involved in Fe transport
VAGDALRIKANVFQNDVTDFIEQTSLVNGQAGQGGVSCDPHFRLHQYQNIPSARIRGAEVESNYDAGSWFLGVAAGTQKGEDLTKNRPLVKIYPAQVATTVGARFWDRKVTVAVRWLAVAAKEAKDVPTGVTAVPTDAFNVVNLYVDYRPTEDVILGLGIDNLFDEQYVKYLDLRTQGSNSLVPHKPRHHLQGVAEGALRRHVLQEWMTSGTDDSEADPPAQRRFRHANARSGRRRQPPRRCPDRASRRAAAVCGH